MKNKHYERHWNYYKRISYKCKKYREHHPDNDCFGIPHVMKIKRMAWSGYYTEYFWKQMLGEQ